MSNNTESIGSFQYATERSWTERIENLINYIHGIEPGICIERGRFVIEAYKENEAEPTMIKRARALEKILENMTIYILPGSLLVGNQASRPRWAPLFPEFAVSWLEEEIFEKNPYYPADRPADPFIIPEPEKTLPEFKEIFDWWRGKTHMDRVYSHLPEEVITAQDKFGAINEYNYIQGGDGHFSPDHGYLIRTGLRKIIDDCKERLANLDKTAPEYHQKREFYQSLIISCEAVIKYAHRYADLALEVAKRTEDPVRRQELEKIAEICRNVPEYPARSFYEAIQFVTFTQIVLQIEDNGQGISVGRFDQFLYDFYKADIESGELTYDKAVELTENFYAMLYTVNRIKSWSDTDFFRGSPMFQNLTVGGIDPVTGQDATNDLTYIALQATADTRLTQPSLTARMHKNAPEKYKKRVAEVIRLGTGYPAVFNDDAYIAALINRGYSVEDASDYCVIGCAEAGPAGLLGGRTGGAWLNMTKILELTLNNGYDPRTGASLHPNKSNKTLAEFSSYEELEEEYYRQLRYYISLEMIMENTIDLLYEKHMEEPLAAALGCPRTTIPRGLPMKKGGAKYDFTGQQTIGTANIANSLYAIKKLVFEDKKLTGEQLLHALHTNFEDNTTNPTGEEIRQMCLNVEKYGNDIDEVDTLAREALQAVCEEQVKYFNTRKGRGPIGCHLHTSTTTVSSNTPFGRFCGATPDGRKAGMPVADGQSPMRGTDVNGPTAALKSVSKLRQVLLSCGSLYNLKFSPNDLAGKNGLKRFISLIDYYFSMGGMQMQFNVVSKETLLEAQKKPEQHKSLLVRVAGYSAYFVTLEKTVQEDIIERTEEALA
ncbi:MAG: formate C-acetyltransferase/glycerol dehydratase family glycyl radical enzyme [Halanaerobiaceae bacterium]|nr:formate C-acetyltransferase/glycerol dehydratase family glycyl radical enzyme [Halanaerobiaceae bacterium]